MVSFLMTAKALRMSLARPKPAVMSRHGRTQQLDQPPIDTLSAYFLRLLRLGSKAKRKRVAQRTKPNPLLLNTNH